MSRHLKITVSEHSMEIIGLKARENKQTKSEYCLRILLSEIGGEKDE